MDIKQLRQWNREGATPNDNSFPDEIKALKALTSDKPLTASSHLSCLSHIYYNLAGMDTDFSFQLLMSLKQAISRHERPLEFLSDRGTSHRGGEREFMMHLR